MPNSDLPEIVGLRELVNLLNVSRRTPHAWAYRRVLPEPDFDSINGLRAWRTVTILKWAAASGRLPKHLRHLGPELMGTTGTLPKRRGRRTDAEYAAIANGENPDETPTDSLSATLDAKAVTEVAPAPSVEPVAAPEPVTVAEPVIIAPEPTPEPIPEPVTAAAPGTTTTAPVVFERGEDGRLYARNVNS